MTVAEPFAALCRDCLTRQAAMTLRCSDCGSPRVLAVDRADGLTLAHVDCDAFYASVEKRDRPDLADKPLIIGGGGRRGVVSTACYIARTRGVRSAMPTAQALKLCPEAIVLAPDMRKYASVAKEIRAKMSELTPLVEPLSIDCDDRSSGSAVVSGAFRRWPVVGRWQSRRRAIAPNRIRDHRRLATNRGIRGCRPHRRGRAPALASGARDRRPQGSC